MKKMIKLSYAVLTFLYIATLATKTAHASASYRIKILGTSLKHTSFCSQVISKPLSRCFSSSAAQSNNPNIYKKYQTILLSGVAIFSTASAAFIYDQLTKPMISYDKNSLNSSRDFRNQKISQLISKTLLIKNPEEIDVKSSIKAYAEARASYSPDKTDIEIACLNSQNVFYFIISHLDSNPEAQFIFAYPRLVEEIHTYELMINLGIYTNDQERKYSDAKKIISEFRLKKVDHDTWNEELASQISKEEQDYRKLNISRDLSNRIIKALED